MRAPSNLLAVAAALACGAFLPSASAFVPAARPSSPPPSFGVAPPRAGAARPAPGTSLPATKFKNFDEMLTAFDKPVLVDFYATWCGPCQLVQKELAVVGDECKDWLKVAKVDTDKYPALGAKYEIEGLPTMVLFKDGKPVHRIEGFVRANQIMDECKQFS
mmetsp:Transcript_25085/g.57977  ORF Transcript_25085/g.57977 Transcript_25085/m.57977 type:complete len:161 (-) Transcript_25085:168-650(-)